MIPSILNLIRWKNLLMIALVQWLVKYALLKPFGVSISLNSFEFTLLMVATICIAAAGNIINDIYDVETDEINKPEQVIIGNHLSEKTAYNLFIILNVLGMAIGFYLSNIVAKSGLFSIFVIVSVLLYVYASYLKQTFLIGNMVISALVALSIIIVGIFELIPAITPQNQGIQLTFFKIILDYAVFAFIINFLREIIKDIEDIDGDHKAGMQTLPIILGRDRALRLLFTLSFIPLLLIVLYINTTLYKQPLAVVYFLVLIVAPLIYTIIKIAYAKTKKDFHSISNLFKLVMLFGMLSMLLYKYVLLS